MGGGEEGERFFRVVAGRKEHTAWRSGEPAEHGGASTVERHGRRAEAGNGRDAQEAKGDFVGQSDHFFTAQGVAPPSSGGEVLRRVRIVGVEQEVEIGKDHRPSSRRVSRSSSSLAR